MVAKQSWYPNWELKHPYTNDLTEDEFEDVFRVRVGIWNERLGLLWSILPNLVGIL